MLASLPARASLRSFITSTSRYPTYCLRSLTPQRQAFVITHSVRTFANNGSQLDGLADLINETAAKSKYSPSLDANSDESLKKARAVYLGNLPLSVDEQFIRESLDGFPGIEDAKFYVIRDKTGHSAGLGFVVFSAPAHADELVRLKAKNWVIKDRKVLVRKSNGNLEYASYDRGPPTASIVLSSLPPSVDLRTVREIFAKFKGVRNVQLLRGDELKSGLSFANFRAKRFAEFAMQILSESELSIDHRIIQAKYSLKNEKIEPATKSLRIGVMGEDKDYVMKILKEHGYENSITRVKFGKNSVFIEFDNAHKATQARKTLENVKLPNDGSLGVTSLDALTGGSPLLHVPRPSIVIPPKRQKLNKEAVE